MTSHDENSLLKSIFEVVGFLILSLILVVKSVILAFVPYRKQKPLKGEIVLITGGGGGLGKLLAERLAKLEAVVVLWDVNEAAIEDTVRLVKNVGGTAYGFKCDLTDKEDVYKIANATRQKVGDVTILINNAGVVSGHLLLDTPDHLIKRTFDVNILSHFWTTKAFLPSMIEKKHGHIVTIASLAGLAGISKLVDYCSSKFAAVGFDEALRAEIQSQGIEGVKTTVICPYFIQSTGMFENVSSRFLPILKSEDVADRIIAGIRNEDLFVVVPRYMRLCVIFKYIVPWECISMFLRGIVQDASPSQKPEKKTDTNGLVVSNSSLIKSTIDRLNGVCKKNM